MKMYNKSAVFSAVYLMLGIMLQCLPLFAQDTKKQTEDGTVHIRIEKYKDGKKEVTEKTYKPGEAPDFLRDNNFSFNNGNIVFHRFNSDPKFSSDTIMFRAPAMVFDFSGLDSAFTKDNFIFRNDFDSLLKNAQKMVFKFDSDFSPEHLDSMLQRQFKEGQRVTMKLNEQNMPMHFDSLMQWHSNFKYNFNFDMNKNGLLDLQPESLHLMLDKDLYNLQEESAHGKKKLKITSKNDESLNLTLNKESYQVEEIETAKGRKMMKITPKKENKGKENKSLKNLRNGMQLSAAELNLYPNPVNGIVTIQMNLPESNITTITIVNPQGKEVYRENLNNFAGNYTKKIDLSKEGRGVFVVQVSQNNEIVSKKVVIQ
jgi:hypothetical protein